MGKTVRLTEDGLRDMIVSEIRKTVGRETLNETWMMKSTEELSDGKFDYERLYGKLKGKIEFLYWIKDNCRTLEELQKEISDLFDGFMRNTSH